MIKDITIWQADGGAVFKLKDTGISKPVFDVQEIGKGKKDVNRIGYEPNLVNDYYISVQLSNYDPTTSTGPARAMRERFLAEHIAKLLNANPPDFMKVD